MYPVSSSSYRPVREVQNATHPVVSTAANVMSHSSQLNGDQPPVSSPPIVAYHPAHPATVQLLSCYCCIRRAENNNDAGLELLRRQLRLVSQRLATLTGRLEVLKAVQQVLPAGKVTFYFLFKNLIV